jgi:hypothetical protein
LAEETKTAINAKLRYAQLQQPRNTVLERARTNSELTIPGLIPLDGQDANTAFSQPYQSLGARCVNNLAAWLLVTLFPPDQAFARLSVHEDAAAELGEQLSVVREALARISTKAMLLVETMACRPIFMEALRHLIISGNALIYFPVDRSSPRMYRLDQYVVVRDEYGKLIEGVVHEKINPAALDEATRTACKVEWDPTKPSSKMTDVYTHIIREGDTVRHYQQINDIVVPGSEGQSNSDATGWMALRWQAVPGSDYGRAHVSEYIGDLVSLEDISKAIIQFAAVASRIVHIVEPMAMVEVDDLAAADTGEFLSGYGEKIKTLQLEKTQDFQIVNAVAERLELRLSHAFMLQSGTVRNAERVTAEEIRAMAQELENVLGGVYTVLSAEWQLPLIKRILYILERDNQAPAIPDSVQPTIVTGFEAMGRNHSANKLRMWAQDMVSMYGPEVISTITEATEVGRRFAESYGIEAVDQLIKTAEMVQEEQQAGMMNNAAMSAVPQLAKGMSDVIAAPDDAAAPPV